MCPYSTESADSAGPQSLKKDYISELIKESDEKKGKINSKKNCISHYNDYNNLIINDAFISMLFECN